MNARFGGRQSDSFMKCSSIGIIVVALTQMPLNANCETPDNKPKSELLKDAQRGNAHSQFLLGQLYLMGWGVGKDEAEAVKWWRLSAEQGNAGSQNALGAAFQFGGGVSCDYSEAVKWYRMAAMQGDSLAQFNLGEMYRNGQGVAQDREEAKMWFKKSSDKGYKRADEAYRKLNETGN